MDTRAEITTWQIAPHAPRLISDAAGTEVICLSGCVWITQYGDERDIVLKAGQSFVLELPTAVVMGSRHGAVLTLRSASPTPRRGLLTRLAGWLDPRTGSAVTRALAGRLVRLPSPAAMSNTRQRPYGVGSAARDSG